MPIEIGVLIDKENGFKKRPVINWGDGGTTILDGKGFMLYGKDGKLYENFDPNCEHAIVCRKVLAERGYTL